MKNATSRASLSFVRRFNGNAKSQLKSEYDAVIIGGGHNGLVAAACLARRGASVCVLERRYLVGGAAVTEQLVPGFRFSRASYLLGLFRPRILSDLRLKEHGLKLFLRDPSSYTPLREEFWKSSDAKSLTLGRDEKKNYQEIAKFSKKDAEAFGRYEAQMGRIAAALDPLWDVSVDRLLRPLGQPSRWTTARALWTCREELATVMRSASALGGDVRPLWELMTSSPRRVLGRWFESEPLLATLATDALIGTMAHTGTPGIGYVLLHHVMGCVEGVRGAWAYPEGGMGAVSEAIAKAAKSHGAEIYTDQSSGTAYTQLVTDVLVDEVGAARGVSTSEGSHVRARVVLSNATPTATLAMLPPEAVGEREAAAYAAIDYESPVTKINVALSRLPDFAADPCPVANRPLPLHKATIHLNCDSCDVVDRAYLDARRGVLPQRPMIEMVVPSSLDRTLAPPGAHVCLLFTQFTPYTLAGGRVWDEQTKQEYAEMVFNCIEEYAPGFKSSVVEKEVLAPPDLEQIFGLTGGNIFHGALRGPQLLTGRPTSEGAACPRTPVERLLLCGAGAHPGGGVTGAPGLIAAEHAARTLGLASP